MSVQESSVNKRTAHRLSATLALLVVAALSLGALFMQAPGADASEYRSDSRDAPTEHSVRGPSLTILDSVNGADSCPDNALGLPGACYVYVNNLKNGDCPTNSVLDGEGKCRMPIGDNADLCIDNWGYLFPPGCRFTYLG